MLELVHCTSRPAQAVPLRTLYETLLAGQDAARSDAARDFLLAQLQRARLRPPEGPTAIEELAPWVAAQARATGDHFRIWLDQRRNGTTPPLFSCLAHALYFLRGVAPTKRVDGAWLYGTLGHWNDRRYRDLIRTYLEELGDGVAGHNHVLIYQSLLAEHGCEQWQDVDDGLYLQGTLQLCLAECGDAFLPELIGYNLGYEQLPLHLLQTAYELNELGIDPWYFSLHITIDNAASGHAQRAVKALQLALPHDATARRQFWRRVQDGWRLNSLGASTPSVIAGFELDAEVLRMLRAKARFGQNMHADYCRIGGRYVNDWLGEAEAMPQFLAALQQQGWIRRGEIAENSRFWALLHGERARMFGVFSGYEEQLLRDWIEGPGLAGQSGLQRRAGWAPVALATPPARHPPRSIVRPVAGGAAENELTHFNQQLSMLDSKDEIMDVLRTHMTPARHSTPLGLMATRIFSRLLD